MWIPLDSELFSRLALAVLLVMFGLIRGYYTREAEARDPEFMKKRHKKETRTYERRQDVVIQDLSAIAWAVPMFLYLLVPSWHTWAGFSGLPILSSLSIFSSLAWIESWVGVGLGAFSLTVLAYGHRTLGEYRMATSIVRSANIRR